MVSGSTATVWHHHRQHTHENDGGLHFTGYCEQLSHELLALAVPLAGEGAGADAEKCRLGFAGKCLPQKRRVSKGSSTHPCVLSVTDLNVITLQDPALR